MLKNEIVSPGHVFPLVARDGGVLERAGHTEASVDIAPPRIADAAIALECLRVQHQEIGRTPVDLFLLEVVRVHIGEDVLADGLPDSSKLGAVGRLGGTGYCTTDQTYEIERPQG